MTSPAVGAALVSSLVVGVFLWQPSAANSAGVQNHNFIGAASCRSCHEVEFDKWAAGPHARALSSLSDKDQKDARCRSCHTMVPGAETQKLEGIQCESCHGAGRYYAKENVMRDRELRERLLLTAPTEQTCLRCHTDSSPSMTPFDYKSALERIRHWPDPSTDAK